jgi:hypothetical protein
MIIDGNNMMLTDGTGIKETGVTDASYGTNIIMGSKDIYDVCQPRYCTLGTDLVTQIDGDTTVTKNLQISGNVNVTGSILNTTYTSLFSSMITGLTTSNAGVYSDSIIIAPGTCTSSDGYLMTLASNLTKDASTAWAPGDSTGGMGSGITLTDDTGYHVFVIGKSTNPLACDAGFDSDTSAGNLLALAGASGYNTYRRIGWVIYTGNSYKLASYTQKGDYFIIHTSTTDGTTVTLASPGADQYMRLHAMPSGVETRARVAIYGYTANNSTALSSWLVGDANGAKGSIWDGMVCNHDSGTSFDPERKECNVWTDKSSQILYTVTTGSQTTLSFWYQGWMDPRGKY